MCQQANFYPRSPCGERLAKTVFVPPVNGISIHALLAESDEKLGLLLLISHLISIHALLAESDCVYWNVLTMVMSISIHALLAESDLA